MYNVTIQDILLTLLIIAMLYVLFRSNPCSENFDTSSELNKYLDPIKNLGTIAGNLINNNGSLIIPANNTTMSGDLNIEGNSIVKGNSNVEGKLTLNNVNRIILIDVSNYKPYFNSPIIDRNGFTIPADKYYYRINSDLLSLVIDEKTRDWWAEYNPNYKVYPGSIIIEFIPRDHYYSNTIFKEKIVNFDAAWNIQKINTTDVNPYKGKIDSNPYK